MEGKANYRPAPGFEHKLHLIGDPKRPIWSGPKGDVPRLFTDRFWIAFEAWRYFNLGLGLPDGLPWDQQDQWLIESIAAMQEHYLGHFSPQRHVSDILLRIVQLLQGPTAGSGRVRK